MIIIIGGGISGLYLGYLLYLNRIPFTILEGHKTGGKIVTKYSHKIPIELGASIFHTKQTHIMSLINKFSIPTKQLGNVPTKYLPPVQEKVEPCPPYVPTAQPVYKVFNTQQKYNNPSYDEIKYMNYNDWKKGHDQVEQVLMCKNGLSEVINALKKYVSPYIQKIRVKTIDLNRKVINGSIQFDKVVVCTSARQAKKLRIKSNIPRWKRVVEASRTIPSVRLYVEFHDKIPYSTYMVGLEAFRWYIPLSAKIALISYVDGARASRFIKQGMETTLTEVLSSLKISPTMVKQTWYAPWSDGFNVLDYKLNTIFKENMEVVKEGVMYQTFLPNENNQAWMEGHLAQVHKVFTAIKSS